jgi:fatty acid synthase subunit beta
MSKDDLLGIIRNHIPASEQLSNAATLERGKATIPLSGIDIPFHSTMLRGEIKQYRECLLSKLKVEDIKPEEFVGRWIPNVVGRPFSLQREYVELVQRITGSEEMRKLLGAMDV